MLNSETPVLDLSYLNEATGGDSDFIAELLQEFQGELSGLYLKLSQAAHKQEKKTVVLLAHTIKGASANLGAERIRAIAAQLELLARADQYTELNAVRTFLEVEIGNLKAATAKADIPSLLDSGQVLHLDPSN